MGIADLRFLIAEDDEFQRRWLAVMLTNLGAKHIVEAIDGRAALTVFQNKAQQIDISFIDLNMPGMDGMELIRHMSKEEHPSSIILASALAPSLVFSVQTMSKAYGVNLLGAIEKPATPETLLALINRYQPPQARLDAEAAAPTFTLADIQLGLKNHEFEPLFQPTVAFATGQIKGAEAFARWKHPQHGWIAPSAFIPILEENGQVDALDWVIIEKSVAACRSWHEQGFPISVSINLSPTSLSNPDFAEKIIVYTSQQALDPKYVVFEVSESATTAFIPYFLENLVRLRMNEFGISVDDYGIGHSSMQELMRIPFSELKIDRSFVVGAAQNESLELVLSMSLELCRKLDRQSVAVGVETRQDWDLLLKRGCSYAQGHYIAKPMENDALPEWIKEWSQFF